MPELWEIMDDIAKGGDELSEGITAADEAIKALDKLDSASREPIVEFRAEMGNDFPIRFSASTTDWEIVFLLAPKIPEE